MNKEIATAQMEIYKLKRDTEMVILDALQQFQRKAGMEVKDVRIITFITDAEVLPFIEDVRIRVELP